MLEILFATSNKGKVLSLEKRLPKDKYHVVQKNIELIEPQGNNSEEVAVAKALYAYKIFNRPLLVQDSSFHVNHLNGFPGVYIKYMQESIGLGGLLRLMEDVEDRTCYFSQSLVFIEDNNKYRVFSDKSSVGSLAFAINDTNTSRSWGEIWRLFIPDWADKPLSSITEEEFEAHEMNTSDESEFGKFACWLEKER